MGLPVIEQFGAPTYGRLKGHEGIVFHTPENGSVSIEAAVATARWQAGTGNTSGGSYHGILGYDDDLGPMSDPAAWVLVKTVPFGQIAGSISTRRDSIWQPERFPWLKELLSDAAYADPNSYLHALTPSGNAAWWSNRLSTDAGRKEVRGALIALARWVRRLERTFDYDAVLNLHRHWQTNRTDPDGLNFGDLVLDEYEQLGSAIPEPTPEPTQPTRAELVAQIATLTTERDEARQLLRVAKTHAKAVVEL